ncbi:MAG TPA: hypothetical protein VGM90_23140 [Kofleriaceae bacterium]|jgi:hypothetical protein
MTRWLVGAWTLAACAGPQHVASDPTLPPLSRTVRYDFSGTARGHGIPNAPPAECSSLVLAERVTTRTKDRELAIDIEVIDGSDKELCGVGSTIHLALRDGRETITASPGTPYDVRDRVAGLHEKLGMEGFTFAVMGRAVLADGKQTPVTVEGVDYIEFRTSGSHEFGDYPSRGTSSETYMVRRRATDQRVACARYFTHTEGVNFEYGSWTSDTEASLLVEYGDGRPNCSEIL